MRLAKKTHSEPIKLQMQILRLSKPRKLSATACGSSRPHVGYSKAIEIAEITIRAAPMRTTRYHSTSTPIPIPKSPKAISTGYNDGAGIWILPGSGAVDGAIAATLTGSSPVASTLPYLATQKASRAVTVGTVAKL